MISNLQHHTLPLFSLSKTWPELKERVPELMFQTSRTPSLLQGIRLTLLVGGSHSLFWQWFYFPRNEILGLQWNGWSRAQLWARPVCALAVLQLHFGAEPRDSNHHPSAPPLHRKETQAPKPPNMLVRSSEMGDRSKDCDFILLYHLCWGKLSPNCCVWAGLEHIRAALLPYLKWHDTEKEQHCCRTPLVY